MDNLNTKFYKELLNCKDPVTLIGVARILKVQLISDKKDKDGHFIPLDGSEILVKVAESFSSLERSRKRELLKIFRKANKEMSRNADRAENTETEAQA